MDLRIVGRSSSHFTRTLRIFAHELAIPYSFVPLLDLLSAAPSDYANNPALRLPVLDTPQGPWFGTLNACRELARRSPPAFDLVWPEQLASRKASNAQELVLQGMASEVTLVMGQLTQPAGAGGGASTGAYENKAQESLQNSLTWLEAELPAILDTIAASALSYLQVTTYCFVTHLAFRRVLDTTQCVRLNAFCEKFGTRASALATSYRFDAAT
jgi:glutathione S-transferase